MTAAKPKRKRTVGFWMDEVYVLGNSVVACIQEDAFGRGFWSYGCDLDWQDSPLGMHPTRRKAEKKAEQWVKDRL